MKRTFWLASYPKSGNTWFRMLLAALCDKDIGPLDINALPDLGGIASSRQPFDVLSLIESGLLTHDEIDCLRPRIYEQLARGACSLGYEGEGDGFPVRFVKAHDAFSLTPKAEPLLGGRRAADGAIVIVRDPRDIAPSLANHTGESIDAAIARMNNIDARACAGAGRQYPQFRQVLLSWNRHVATWLEQTDIPVHLVRYEDMKVDAAKVLSGALAFCGMAISEEAVVRAVERVDFAEARRQEDQAGFRESASFQKGGDFFRRGEAGAWRDELTPEQTALIEAHHSSMMLQLGYELAGAAPRAAFREERRR